MKIFGFALLIYSRWSVMEIVKTALMRRMKKMTCKDCKFYEKECESHFQEELIGRKRSIEICEIFYPEKDRLIDAYQFRTKLDAIIKERKKAGVPYAVLKIAHIIAETCDTVDAVPAVHGRWEDFCGDKMCCCSVCKAEFDNTCNEIHGEWNYCPNCGAKMDLE